ncbi:hypothetical protein RDI58_008317 [Solanum bulbocastanum]|uniref:Uncharacterized protein n=1 Tax=Solanum bulbocastanum TaxID=147425 RepID=A0AAN8TX06_SOLBU
MPKRSYYLTKFIIIKLKFHCNPGFLG